MTKVTTPEQQYLNILKRLTKADIKQDRTGTGTRAIFCDSMRFDLQEGFPLLTTKRVFWKGVVAELLWFLSGSQDERELCQLTYGTKSLDKKTIWTDNCADRAKLEYTRFNGYNMGNMYNVAWRALPCSPNGLTKIARRLHIDKDVDESHNFESVFQHCKGYLGPINYVMNDTSEALFDIWADLMEKHETKEAFVCNRWLCFSDFLHDCYSLQGFQEYVDSGYKYVLDAEYYGSSVYSPETSLFLSKDVKKTLFRMSSAYEIEGKLFRSKVKATDYKKLIKSDSRVTEVYNNSEYVIRPQIFIDQISNMIEEIKNNPNSRRIIVDAWNPRGTGNAVLGVCHPTFQVVVNNGKIDLVFMMRSSDFFLGAPFNIASYALLTHMIADQTGYEVGELVYEGHDIHLYSNHIDQAKEQLTRECFPLPSIKIINKRDSIFDYKVEDFELVDYQYHPSISAPMAV